jgi:hypothetical protein
MNTANMLRLLFLLFLAVVLASFLVWVDANNSRNRQTLWRARWRGLSIRPTAIAHRPPATNALTSEYTSSSSPGSTKAQRFVNVVFPLVFGVLISGATAYSIVWVSLKLYDHFVDGILNQGFSAGIGLIIIASFTFPITFVCALVLWLDASRPRLSMAKDLASWLVALPVSLGLSTPTAYGLANSILRSKNWTVSFDGDDGGMLLLLGIGFPALTLSIYAWVLRRVHRPDGAGRG